MKEKLKSVLSLLLSAIIVITVLCVLKNMSNQKVNKSKSSSSVSNSNSSSNFLIYQEKDSLSSSSKNTNAEANFESVDDFLITGLRFAPKNSKILFPDISQVKSVYIQFTTAIMVTQDDIQKYYFDLDNKSQKNIVSSILKLLNSQTNSIKDENENNFGLVGLPTSLNITLKSNKTISFIIGNYPIESKIKVLCISGTYFKNQKIENNPTLIAFMDNSDPKIGWDALVKFMKHVGDNSSTLNTAKGSQN